MIDSIEAQRVISKHRKNAIVVATFTTGREWPQVSTLPEFDLATTMPMGKASSIGLGLALAQPSRKVIVLDGDGSLLMNLGSLVTIANMAPANFVHFVFENGIYRTTGGQPIPNAGKISFSGLAKCAGYRNVHDFADLVKLENAIETVLSQTGPTFACLKVPACNERSGFALAKMNTVIAGFMATLQRPEQMSAPGHPFVKTVD